MRLLALFTILAISTLSSSEVGEQGEITREQKWVTAPPSDENAPNWVGYIWNGVSFQGYICNPGAAFTVIGNAAGCVSATDHVTIMQTSCSDTSVLVGPPGYTPFTCPGEACSVGFIFKNFIDTTTTTIVSCGDRGETTSINFTVYRATTYATTTPTTFQHLPRQMAQAPRHFNQASPRLPQCLTQLLPPAAQCICLQLARLLRATARTRLL